MKTHQLVLDWIERELQSGRIAVGHRLPGERALAEQLSVSRTSVREAIRILEAMGAVRQGTGSGRDAGTVITAEPAAALASTLKLHMLTSHLPVADIVQSRVLLESWAATHADPSAPGLDTAQSLLDEMDSPGIEAEDFLALDARFHVALAEAAGNAVVGAIMASLRQAIQGYASSLRRNLPDWNATRARLQAEHRGIVAAIRAGDSAAAADLVGTHVEGYYREAGLGQAPHPQG